MKKKFKETKFGKLVTGRIVKGGLTALPFGIGSLLGNILEEKKGDGQGEVVSPAGSVDKDRIATDVIKVLFYIVLAVLFLKGVISLEEADSAKGLIGN